MKKNPINYFKGVLRETKRIKWPTKEKLFPAIGTVVFIMVLFACILALWDLAANNITTALKEVFKGIQG